MFDDGDDCCRTATIFGLGEGSCGGDIECEGNLKHSQ